MITILAADIGGTSSRFGHFAIEQGLLHCVGTTWLRSGEMSSFDMLLESLEEQKFSLLPRTASVAVFAIAGPVQGGVYCDPPNISWDVDLRRESTKLLAPHAVLMNDFLAQGYACRSPVGARALLVLPGTAAEERCVATIGAGTGLGKAFLLPDGRGGYVGGPSEGGHVNAAIESDREREFERFALERIRRPFLSWEEIVSGRGLALLHEFLTGDKLSPAEVAATFEGDSETVEWFARFYGRVCRNFALETLCFGGLYIAGGVAVKNQILVTHPAFGESFRAHPVQADVLARIPVWLIADEESGVYGAALFGAQILRHVASGEPRGYAP